MIRTLFCLYLAMAVLMNLVLPAESAKLHEKAESVERSECDGLEGLQLGLCNVYCEAWDCDSETPHSSEEDCEKGRVARREARNRTNT